MTITLPADARQHIEDRDPMAAVAALAEAANRGEIDVSAVIAFAKASNSGTPITYQKTRPVSLRIKEFIEANPTEPPLKLVYLGVARRLWTEADCDQWQLNAAALSDARKTSVSRGVYLTRNRRTQGRIAQVSDQFVPKIALDIVCSHKLTDGAKLCLEILMALAGKGNRVVTYTASIARMLGRTPRTVRNHFIQLEAAGLITRTAGRAANTVQIVIHDMVKPEPYKEPRDITAFKLARRSADPALRNLAETLTALSWEKHHGDVQGTETGRKKISAFNPESKQRESDEREICQDDDQRIAKAGVTTHSNFVMTYKTNRNDWNRRKPERYGQQPMVSSSLPSTR